MLTDLAKLRRRRRRTSKRVSSKAIENPKRVGESARKKETVVCDRELLKNKNLSIMTDNEPELYLKVGGTYLKKKERSFDDYVIVGNNETPVTPFTKNANDNSDSESAKTLAVPGKPRSPRSSSWYSKLRSQVLKSLRNKVYPCVITG